MRNVKTLCVSLPADLVSHVQSAARARSLSVSTMIRLLVEDSFKKSDVLTVGIKTEEVRDNGRGEI